MPAISRLRYRLFALTLLSSLPLATTTSVAQEKFKYSFQNPPDVKSTYNQLHEVEVGDMPGHKLRLVELQAVYPASGPAPTYSGVRVKESRTILTGEFAAGSGSQGGYSVTTLESGDKIYAKFSVLVQTQVGEDGKSVTSYSSTSFITGGTGKFKGIRGVTRSSGSSDLKTAARAGLTEGEYYFVD